MCLGFVNTGHTVTLAASEEYKPQSPETYDPPHLRSQHTTLFIGIIPIHKKRASELRSGHIQRSILFPIAVCRDTMPPQNTDMAGANRTPKKIPSAAVKNLVPNDRPAVPEKSPSDYSQIEARLRFHQILPAQCYGYGIGPRDKRR